MSAVSVLKKQLKLFVSKLTRNNEAPDHIQDDDLFIVKIEQLIEYYKLYKNQGLFNVPASATTGELKKLQAKHLTFLEALEAASPQVQQRLQVSFASLKIDSQSNMEWLPWGGMPNMSRLVAYHEALKNLSEWRSYLNSALESLKKDKPGKRPLVNEKWLVEQLAVLYEIRTAKKFNSSVKGDGSPFQFIQMVFLACLPDVGLNFEHVIREVVKGRHLKKGKAQSKSN